MEKRDFSLFAFFDLSEVEALNLALVVVDSVFHQSLQCLAFVLSLFVPQLHLGLFGDKLVYNASLLHDILVDISHVLYPQLDQVVHSDVLRGFQDVKSIDLFLVNLLVHQVLVPNVIGVHFLAKLLVTPILIDAFEAQSIGLVRRRLLKMVEFDDVLQDWCYPLFFLLLLAAIPPFLAITGHAITDGVALFWALIAAIVV